MLRRQTNPGAKGFLRNGQVFDSENNRDSIRPNLRRKYSVLLQSLNDSVVIRLEASARDDFEFLLRKFFHVQSSVDWLKLQSLPGRCLAGSNRTMTSMAVVAIN